MVKDARVTTEYTKARSFMFVIDFEFESSHKAWDWERVCLECNGTRLVTFIL